MNLLLFHLVVTMRMFIFYAIGIHERASEYDSQPAYYFEKNFKYRKFLRSIFREKFIQVRITKIIRHSSSNVLD